MIITIVVIITTSNTLITVLLINTIIKESPDLHVPSTSTMITYRCFCFLVVADGFFSGWLAILMTSESYSTSVWYAHTPCHEEWTTFHAMVTEIIPRCHNIGKLSYRFTLVIALVAIIILLFIVNVHLVRIR